MCQGNKPRMRLVAEAVIALSAASNGFTASELAARDAWLLDPFDQLAARLARDGDPEPTHIEENDTTLAIGNIIRSHSDRDTGRVTTILNYPTYKLAQIA